MFVLNVVGALFEPHLLSTRSCICGQGFGGPPKDEPSLDVAACHRPTPQIQVSSVCKFAGNGPLRVDLQFQQAPETDAQSFRLCEFWAL